MEPTAEWPRGQLRRAPEARQLRRATMPKFTKRNAKKMARRSHTARRASPINADASIEHAPVGEEKLPYREIIEWVWEHLHEECPAAPNRKARELWRYAKKNPDGFLDKYVPMLMRGDGGDKQLAEEDDGACADYLKIVDDMLGQMNAEHAREQEVWQLLKRWEPRFVAAENGPDLPAQLWLELATIFRTPLRRCTTEEGRWGE